MKIPDVKKRFFIGSLVLGLVVPDLYHIGLSFAREEHFTGLMKQICAAVEPRIQVAAYRDALEAVQAAVRSQGLEVVPDVVLIDHGKQITPEEQNPVNTIEKSCEFGGVDGISLSVLYAPPTLKNSVYLYLYLLSVPLLWLLFLGLRLAVIRFQKTAADRVESQIKVMLGMEDNPPKKTGVIDRAFDLELPLLKNIKERIETLEKGLASYSQKIAEQQKKSVLTDVAAQMAHDIVTPITILQTILSESAERDEALVKSELSRIKSLAEKLLSQYRGSPAAVEGEFDVGNAVGLAVIEAKSLPQANGIAISYEPHTSSLTTRGNFHELAAAMANILKNGIEALDKVDSRLSIVTRVSGQLAEIVVKDNGCGIAPELLNKVFDKGVTFKNHGTGLGLFQARSATQSMGGTIEIKSTHGLGTELQILMPLVSASKPRDTSLTLANKNIQTLVLIDDSRANQIAWRLQAEKLGVELKAFDSGSEFIGACSSMDRSTPIYIDYHFEDSDMTGADVAKDILNLGFTKVFIATDYPMDRISTPFGILGVVGKQFPDKLCLTNLS